LKTRHFCGFDASKPTKGHKRHIITDTCGNMIACQVHTANIRIVNAHPGSFQSCVARPRECALSSPIAAMSGQAARRPGQPRALDATNHQAIRYGHWLRSPARTMGGRTHLRMAQPLPPPSTRLGETHRKRRGMGPHRSYSTHDAPPCKALKSFTPYLIGHETGPCLEATSAQACNLGLDCLAQVRC